MEDSEKHKSCMRKKYKYLNNRKKSISFDKSKAYYENYSPKNWKNSIEIIKESTLTLGSTSSIKLRNFDSRKLSRFERFLVIELF